MIKIRPKWTSEENEKMHRWGYELMKAAFDDLVFCGNVAGSVPAGTEHVLVDADTDSVRRSIVDIWMACEGIDAQPDDVLEIEFVYGRLV